MRGYLRVLPVCALFAACTAVRDVRPAELTPPHAPTRVWAQLSNYAVMVFDSASVRGDTLIGVVGGEQHRLLLSKSAALKAREPSRPRTLAVLTLTAGAIAAASWYLMDRGEATSTPHPCGFMCMIDTNCYCC